MSSPTQRTLDRLRRGGYVAGVVEKWIPQTMRRLDFLGCIDVIGCLPGRIIGIQACAGASHAARRAKAVAEPRLRAWLEAGGVFEIWSWSKRGARGKRKLWTLRTERLSLADLPPVTPSRPIRETIEAVRAAGGSGWDRIEDPEAFLGRDSGAAKGVRL